MEDELFKTMSGNISDLIKPLLVILMLVGFFLITSNTSFVIGFLLSLGAIAGMVVLVRRSNTRALEQDERAAWELIRAKGKRHFILKAVMYGFIVGLIFLFVQLIFSHWVVERLSTFGLVLIAASILLYTGGSYYAAIRTWSLNEERYKESRNRS